MCKFPNVSCFVDSVLTVWWGYPSRPEILDGPRMSPVIITNMVLKTMFTGIEELGYTVEKENYKQSRT